jgi:hypothetical protein
MNSNEFNRIEQDQLRQILSLFDKDTILPSCASYYVLATVQSSYTQNPLVVKSDYCWG